MQIVWLNLIAGAGLVSLLPVLRRLRGGLRGTALEYAGHAIAAVWMSWLFALSIQAAPTRFQAWSDVVWYFSSVLALTPPIAALGARRPASRVWTWFVLVPLVLVFTWPLVATLRQAGGPAAFNVEEPVVVGFVLVLVMGAGNYVGLRFSPSAILWIAGLLLVVLPLCPSTAGWVPAAAAGRVCGTLCVVAAGWIADLQAARGGEIVSGPGIDHVWRDFRDLFGIVWARRIQERFNDDARRQGLALRLGIDGLQRPAGTTAPAAFDPQSLADAETSLRWLLQKFVDPDWIDRRLTK